MAMMDKMRAGSDSPWVQGILVCVFVSFVYFGGMFSSNDTVSAVATVNGTQILDIDAQPLYKRALDAEESQRMQEAQAQSARTGSPVAPRPLSEDDEKALFAEVKKALIRNELLRQQAQSLGLVVSTDEIALVIAHDPNFKNDEGEFDKTILANMLRRQGLSLEKYQAKMEDELLVQKLQRLVLSSVDLPEALVKSKWLEASTTMDISYVMVQPRTFKDDVDVSPAAVAAFVESSKDQIEASYKADYDRLYNLPETADLSVIRLEVREDGVTLPEIQARVEGLRAQVEAGADFAELARRHSEDLSVGAGGSLGAVPLTQLEPAVLEAIKDLKPGALSAILADEKQVRFFKLSGRTAARVIPLEEVKNDIATRLLQEKGSTTKAAEYAEKLLAAWKVTGVAPADLLAEQQLSTESSGPIPLEGTGRPTDPPPEMLKAAAATTPGTVLPGVYVSGEVLYVGMLTDRKVPDESEYEAQKEGVRMYLTRERQTEFFQGWVDALEKSARIQ